MNFGKQKFEREHGLPYLSDPQSTGESCRERREYYYDQSDYMKINKRDFHDPVDNQTLIY